MLNLLKLITIFGRRQSGNIPAPWDDVPNSEAATLDMHSGTVELKPIIFSSGSGADETATLSIHSTTISFLEV